VGLAIFGAIVSIIWFPVAFLLGKRYESARSGSGAAEPRGASEAH
jgi:hypothetical protein